MVERWGDFVLVDDLSTAPRMVEGAGPRWNFPWPDDVNVWDHTNARVTRDPQEAERDERVPLSTTVPGEEEFLAASIVADEHGAADGAVAYIRRSHPDISRYGRPETGPQDRTLFIAWSARYTWPAYAEAHDDPRPFNAKTLEDSSLIEELLSPVDILGYRGLLRVWSVRGRQSLYGGRLPSVILNWYADGILWTVQSIFLTVEEVLAVAEGIRPTVTPHA